MSDMEWRDRYAQLRAAAARVEALFPAADHSSPAVRELRNLLRLAPENVADPYKPLVPAEPPEALREVWRAIAILLDAFQGIGEDGAVTDANVRFWVNRAVGDWKSGRHP
jgi:hypothetical protein